MKDPDRKRATDRAYWHRLKAKNADRIRIKRLADRNSAHRQAKRYIRKRCPGALVTWTNDELVRAIYPRCAELNKTSLERYEVDHIVPLLNDTVCGLHCEHNLRVITALENNTKNGYAHEVDGNVDLLLANDSEMFPGLEDKTGGGGFPYN